MRRAFSKGTDLLLKIVAEGNIEVFSRVKIIKQATTFYKAIYYTRENWEKSNPNKTFLLLGDTLPW